MIEKHLGDCADVTALKSIQARESTSRRMPAFLTRESTSCPTILKSQDRGVKDAVYIQDGGRIYKPSVDLVQELMSILIALMFRGWQKNKRQKRLDRVWITDCIQRSWPQFGIT